MEVRSWTHVDLLYVRAQCRVCKWRLKTALAPEDVYRTARKWSHPLGPLCRHITRLLRERRVETTMTNWAQEWVLLSTLQTDVKHILSLVLHTCRYIYVCVCVCCTRSATIDNTVQWKEAMRALWELELGVQVSVAPSFAIGPDGYIGFFEGEKGHDTASPDEQPPAAPTDAENDNGSAKSTPRTVAETPRTVVDMPASPSSAVSSEPDSAVKRAQYVALLYAWKMSRCSIMCYYQDPRCTGSAHR